MILDEIVFVFCSLFATSSLQHSLFGKRMYRGHNEQVETYYIWLLTYLIAINCMEWAILSVSLSP